MLSDATRPPWLYQKHKLEEFVQEHNWTLSIVQLRCDRNRCQLVDNILEKIALKEHLNPSEFEKGLARNHLAVDLQNILQRWCGIGLQKTIEGSALLGSAQKPPSNRWTPPISVERVDTMPKVEVASPEATMFSPHTTTFNYVGSGDSYQPRPRDVLLSSQQLPLGSRAVKRPLDDADQNDDATKMPRIDRASSFICPYYARNKHTPDHAQCATKTFPNPRKLKEHVWRWLKPFKCANCGEGFGREKTRAIHCEQRKTKCKKAVSTYENSAEWRRDLQIESAKSTDEMIRIFDEYEKEVSELKSQNHNNHEGSSAESEGSCSSPEPQSDFPNGAGYNASDSEMDGSRDDSKYGASRRVELIERRPPMDAIRPRAGSLHQTHIPREGLGSTLEDLTPQDCSSRVTNGHQLSPIWQQGGDLSQFNSPQTRRKSEPLVHYASNIFSQESNVGTVGVPEITITQHEPPLDFEMSFDQDMYQMPNEIREPSCMTDPMDEESQNDFPDISPELQLANRGSSQTILLHSNGYGSIPSFHTRFRF